MTYPRDAYVQACEAGRRAHDAQESARTWAVALEQECAYLRAQIAGASAVAEQLGCLCEFIILDGEPCGYCTLRAFLTLPPDGLTLDVIESRAAVGATAEAQR